jgi:outer membrane biosynthesis protein TonB
MKRLVILVIAAALSGTATRISNEALESSRIQEQDFRHGDHRLEHADVPTYPESARQLRIAGTVEVLIVVKDGVVVNSDVKSGPTILRETTLKNIESWRFYHLVNISFTTKFVYQLEPEGVLDPQNSKVELQLPLLAKISAVAVKIR